VEDEGKQTMPGEITIAPPLRIITADPQAEMRVHYQTILPALGHKLLTAAGTGRELIEHCRQHGPDLVIADCKLPDMDVVDVAEEVCRAQQVPFIVTADHFDPQQLRHSGADHFWAMLIKPISRMHLEMVIPFVLHRFKKMQAFLEEVKSLRLHAKSGNRSWMTQQVTEATWQRTNLPPRNLLAPLDEASSKSVPSLLD
jgi:AmiR/NasT family two-component response regulator